MCRSRKQVDQHTAGDLRQHGASFRLQSAAARRDGLTVRRPRISRVEYANTLAEGFVLDGRRYAAFVAVES